MADKLGTEVKFKATKVEYPGKTLEEIQAEVDAFNAQELAKVKQEND